MNTPSIPQQGLTGVEAAARLAAEGYNELLLVRRRSAPIIALEVIREPMFALLLGAGVLYALIGDLGEALVLLLFATISISIAVVQSGRSERVLEALRDLASPRALVIRDGLRQRIPGREVVTGDLLVLDEGDRIPADARLISGTDLHVAEAILTGESVPVRKQCGEDSAMLYSGTLIVRGNGLAVVEATGNRTEIGKLGRTMQAIEPEVPQLQRQTRRLVLSSAIAGALVSILAVILYGVTRGDWIEALLGGIALAMSMLPEEFPLVLTVFMVMGAWRLSRSQVLTRRATAIETLGAATVLCTDKTGTLTRNVMSVTRLVTGASSWNAGAPAQNITADVALSQLLRTAALASDPLALDPMDRAVFERISPDTARGSLELVKIHPLRRDLLAVAQVWRETGAQHGHVSAKGAPEAIARLCGMDDAARAALLAQVDVLAQQGIRVLAAARAELADADSPDDISAMQFRCVGLIGFADPLRDSVPAAVAECRSAGVRVVMITGDYPQTARAIAGNAGMDMGDCLTGAELEQLTDDQLAQRVQKVTVFARITPQQKLRIVESMKRNGEVVAMTGDGVNDAAALKAAHIGIAMGGRGTDVAREAASLVLLDDDFGSIVRAIRLGRRIYDNLQKAIGYILAVHVPIAGLALLPVLLGAPLLLTPLLIALLELVIDPTCSIVLEAEREERDVMQRPPRSNRAALVTMRRGLWCLAQGLLGLAAVATVYFHATARGLPLEQVRFAAFLALILVNVALLLANRGFASSAAAVLGRSNPALWWGLGATVAMVVGMAVWPLARGFFGIEVPDGRELALCLGAGVVVLVLLQVLKALGMGRQQGRLSPG